jgi:paraquat-inducible protein A
MNNPSSLIVCRRCDAVYRRPDLARDHVGTCTTCGAVIVRSRRLTMEGWTALNLTTAIMFLLANTLPIVSLGVGNLRNDVTLWDATTSLIRGPWAPFAASATVVAIVIPFIQIVLLGWVLAFAWKGQRAPGFRGAMRVLLLARPWSMMDVALLGVIIASIKLSHMAAVSYAPGLWSLMVLVCLTALTANGDVRWLWTATEPTITDMNPGHG